MTRETDRLTAFQEAVSRLHHEDLQVAIGLLDREAKRADEAFAKRSENPWQGASYLGERARRARRAANAMRRLAQLLPVREDGATTHAADPR